MGFQLTPRERRWFDAKSKSEALQPLGLARRANQNSGRPHARHEAIRIRRQQQPIRLQQRFKRLSHQQGIHT